MHLPGRGLDRKKMHLFSSYTFPVYDIIKNVKAFLLTSVGLLQISAAHPVSACTGWPATPCEFTGAARPAITAPSQRWWATTTTTTTPALPHLDRTAATSQISSVGKSIL